MSRGKINCAGEQHGKLRRKGNRREKTTRAWEAKIRDKYGQVKRKQCIGGT